MATATIANPRPARNGFLAREGADGWRLTLLGRVESRWKADPVAGRLRVIVGNDTALSVRSHTVITVQDVLERFSAEIGGSRPAGWDVDGLQLGDAAADVATVGVCHEVTDAVLDRLVATPVDLLVAYHPLLFRPVTAVTAGSGPAGRAFRLLSSATALGIAHTSFDAAPGGTADALADVLELSDVVGFGPSEPAPQIKLVTFLPGGDVDAVTDALSQVGGGVIGRYTHCSFRTPGTGTFLPEQGANPVVGVVGSINAEDEIRLEMIAPASRRDALVSALVAVHPYEEPAFDVYEVTSNTGFIGRLGSWSGTVAALGDLVATRLGAEGLRVSGDAAREIHRVAVVPGSGGDFLASARSLGADAVVTGDVSHHRIVAARDRGLAVVDPGHTPTERPGMGALLGAIERAVGGETAVVDLTDADPTPWR